MSFIRSIAVVSHLVYIVHISDTNGYCIFSHAETLHGVINTEIDCIMTYYLIAIYSLTYYLANQFLARAIYMSYELIYHLFRIHES